MVELVKFNRLLPNHPISMTGAVYIDVNDIEDDERLYNKEYFANDPAYVVLKGIGEFIPKGRIVDRQYCVYIYHRGLPVGNIVLREHLDNPDGYGKDDFIFFKFIWDKYQHTKYSRYAIADLMHIIFQSGIGRRMYCYIPSKNNSESFIEAMDDTHLPCAGSKFETDGIGVQTYAHIRKRYSILDKYLYILVEFNGNEYNNMDLLKYFMTIPGRDINKVKEWLTEMNNAVDQVKQYVLSAS